MAVQTIYLLGTVAVTPNWWGNTQLNGSAPTAANSTFGYNVDSTPLSSPYWRSRLGASGISSVSSINSFVGTAAGPVRGTAISATGDSFVAGPFWGTFDNTVWTCNFNVRGGVPGATGHINMRVWRSLNADGSSATEITAGIQIGITVSVTNTSEANSQIIFSPGTLALNNEYLFFQTEWQETVTGTSGGSNVFYRIGPSAITTPDFLPTVVSTLSLNQTNQTVAAIGRSVVGGSLVSIQAAQTVSATGFFFNFTGRITTRASGRVIAPLPLSGRIGTRNSARVAIAGPGDLYARLTSRTRARGRVDVAGELSGRVTTRSFARVLAAVNPPFSGRISARVFGRIAPLFPLSGRITLRASARAIGTSPSLIPSRITTRVSARVSVFLSAPFSGRITTRAVARVGFALQPTLQGRISTRSSGGITLEVITANIEGRITTRSAASFSSQVILALAGCITTRSTLAAPAYAVAPILAGRITARTAARGTALAALRIPLSGLISTTSAARTIAAFSGTIYLTGSIRSTITARVSYNLATWLAGRTATSVRAGVTTLQPVIELFRSRLITLVKGQLLTSELLQPLPPYPPAFPTPTLEYYLSLITSEHIDKPRYVRTVTDSLAPLVANQELVAAIPGLFDLDYSIGEQEDFTGQWVGKTRWIQVPVQFFSWDTTRAGWNQANWKGPFDSTNSLQRLDDYHYRLLLYATVIANHWDGSVPQAYEAWDTLFRYTGLKVVIQDYGNMTMMYGIMWEKDPDLVLAALFVSGQMDLKPEGIAIVAYIFQTAPELPFFGFDGESNSIAGWDDGSWGILVPPGVGSLPIL